jgi:Xaa-Pro aminopeptidase
MILSNEPGYYRAGEYGIRLENLVLVEPRAIPGGERSMLGFETLTLAPFDRRLIALDLLRSAERAWIDAYHARVRDTLGPHLDGPTRAWLLDATRPLA